MILPVLMTNIEFRLENRLVQWQQTTISLIPFVALMVDIPDSMSGSWYSGDVHILYKDSAFYPSSPIQLATELATLLKDKALTNPVLFVYSDGGSDHIGSRTLVLSLL